MADVIVSSVFIRLRHPVHEAELFNSFDATTQEWVVNASGIAKPLEEEGPFTPQQLEAKGLGLPVLLNQAMQTAMKDRVDALALVVERDNALEAANDRISELERELAELRAAVTQSLVLAEGEATSETKKTLISVLTFGAIKEL